MLKCFWTNVREFVSSPLDGTENLSRQSLRISLLSNGSAPTFSGVSAATRRRDQNLNQPTAKTTKCSANTKRCY